MSKLLQIEQALLSMDGGRFQQLCDAYLHRRGYEAINPLGRVVGTDKVAKGTPDTWIVQPDGKFVFAEYTTQQQKLGAKVLSDFQKCIDEVKTGVPVDRIQDIVFVFTGSLEPRDATTLLRSAAEAGVLVTPIGIGQLAHDLYDKYPRLALEYLGVEIDTGQVLTPRDFVAAYGSNALATPLDTHFTARTGEVDRVLAALDSSGLVVLSGRPGVGKSRLALECLDRFAAKHREWIPRCILNRGRDLFQDIKTHFASPGKYLIFVDDANRISGFEYILQLLRERRADRDIKVIATVRDYALPMIRDAIRSVGGAVEIEVAALSDDQIRAIVEEEFQIAHHLYLERITEIAKGNPRLAVMAARVIVRERTLSSIADVTTLYDEYYESARQDLDALADRVLLRAAGIISFFRTVDRLHTEQMSLISTNFGIAADAFWDAARSLHGMELVDIYEDEVVKVSDQVLATYLFYLAFFKERNVLDVGVLIEHFFPAYRYRLTDSLGGVLNAFDVDTIITKLRPHVERQRIAAAVAADESRIVHLVDAFWYTSPTDALLAIQERVQEMEIEPVGDGLRLNYQQVHDTVPEGTLLHALGNFRYAGESRRVAFELLLEYAARRPVDMPHVLRLLVERYGFRHTSYAEGYKVERDVVDALTERLALRCDEPVVSIFFVVAASFLRTKFRRTESRDVYRIAVVDFNLPHRTDLTELRGLIWMQLIALADGPHRAQALNVLYGYAASPLDASAPDIIADDAQWVIPFLESKLDPGEFTECVTAQKYLDLLDRHAFPYPDTLRDRFQSATYKLWRLLVPTWEDRMKMGWDKFGRWHANRLREAFESFSVAEYCHLFDQVALLLKAARNDQDTHQLRASVENLLVELAAREPELFATVLENYLERGNPLALGRHVLPAALVAHCGPVRALQVLRAYEYPGRHRWLFDFYSVLPTDQVDDKRLAELYALFQTSDCGDFPFDLAFLSKYAPVAPNVFASVVEILLEKAKRCPDVSRSFASLFNLGEGLPVLFSGHEELLGQAYLWMQKHEQYSDHDGSGFNMLLNLNPGFACTYVDWVFEHHVESKSFPAAPDPSRDHRNYDFIWHRDDHRPLMEAVIQRVFELEQERIAFRSFASVFFAARDPDPEEQGSTERCVRERQDRFLVDLIARRAKDGDFMAWLFDTLASFSPSRRFRFLEAFLTHNRDFDDFRRLALDHKMWSATGSFVPVYQKRIEMLESFLPLFRSADLLRHRKLVEDEIQEYHRMTEIEKRENFMRY